MTFGRFGREWPLRRASQRWAECWRWHRIAAPPPMQAGSAGHGRTDGRGGAERQLEMMTKKLNLSPDQVTQMKAIERMR